MIATLPADVPDLIPVRMLNEYCYCPRLAYLEWVQGEFAENLETREGTFAHRRVDRKDRRDVPVGNATVGDAEDESDRQTIHARSLMLSAPTEGLIAKLDLVEVDGLVATPVDYKRGSVPDVPERAWEPERVQLCAQGLILREAGYTCDHGVLYFVESRRRVTVTFDEALIERTRELVRQLRRTATSPKIPPPLKDSPKCPRCSLVGICLPDETARLAESQTDRNPETGSKSGTGPLRKLLATRTDALPLYLQAQGMALGKTGDCLAVKERKQTVQRVRLNDVSQVSLFGNISVSAPVIRELAEREIPICHFSFGGWFHSLTRGLSHKNVQLRIEQYRTFEDESASLPIARQMIAAKIRNSRTLLRRHWPDEDRSLLKELNTSRHRAERASSIESLLGIEGMAAKRYFSGLAKLLRGGTAFRIEGRNRRPPTDPVNALLSLVYALLVKDVTVTLHAVGFDPLLGFYHRPRYGRPALALDLAEEFRPLIGDSVVLGVVNNGEVGESDFVSQAGAVNLTEAGRRSVIQAYERRLETEVTHPLFGYKLSYRRLLEVQARLLARVLSGEIATYPGFCTR